MSPAQKPRPPGAAASGGSSAQERQRDVSNRLAGAGRRSTPAAARRAAGRPIPPRTQVLARPRKGRPARIQPTAMLLRFISCGLISLAAGLAWFLTHRNERVSPAGALLGALLLLSGFVAGGLLWYVADARRRARDPRRVDDEYIVFSFVVFVVVPAMVLVLVLLVWLVALLVAR
ncbi:MAG TPA: hypothetical protein VI316_06190 [Candidatus Dormibacteraeota bacterium]